MCRWHLLIFRGTQQLCSSHVWADGLLGAEIEADELCRCLGGDRYTVEWEQ